MMFVVDNQLLLISLFFLGGCAVTALLFRKPKGHRAWHWADFVWVMLGGFGALVAVIAGIYTSGSSRVDRQIDPAFVATVDFDRNAARFRLSYCGSPAEPAVEILCDKVDFLSASTAENADLPLFIALTEKAAPLSGLHLFFATGREDGADARGRRCVRCG